MYDPGREEGGVRRWAGAAFGVALAASLAAAQGPAHRPRTELTILTGSELGTYYAVARDLERVAEEVAPGRGVDLDVVPSQGALQNAIEVFRHDAIHLGITQLDVVSYLSIYGKDNAEARRVVEGLQVVLPLYDEEVHLLARPGVHGIAGLRGKRVAIGEPGSGTTVTAMTLLHLAGVKPRDLQTLEAAEALDALRTGEIDAAFHVVGAPARLLLERIAPADRITLVPIRLEPHPEDAAMAAVYRPTTIPAGTYPWQAGPVATVAVRSGITTAGATRCEAIGELARLAVDHLDWLRANGHPKWQAVTLDPARLLAAPRLSPCVAQRLGR
jgi:TRAP transporter TAXI family solute receptor